MSKENISSNKFKGSKAEYIWEFILDESPQKLELIIILNGLWKKFIKNGTEVVDIKKVGSHLKILR